LNNKSEFIIRLALSIILLYSSVYNAFSSMQHEFIVVSGRTVLFGVILGVAAWGQRYRSLIPPNLTYSSALLDLAFFGQLVAATTQALATVHLPAPFLVLHSTPGIAAVYLAAATVLASAAAWMVLEWGDARRVWAG
jgi:hypothetical protein